MSFYVTIPCDSSMDVFKLNTQSNFSVLLKEDIQFNVDYEVALVEMNYQQAVRHVVGQIEIIVSKNKSIVKDLEVYDGESVNFHTRMKSLFDALNKSDNISVTVLFKDNTIEFNIATQGFKDRF